MTSVLKLKWESNGKMSKTTTVVESPSTNWQRRKRKENAPFDLVGVGYSLCQLSFYYWQKV